MDDWPSHHHWAGEWSDEKDVSGCSGVKRTALSPWTEANCSARAPAREAKASAATSKWFSMVAPWVHHHGHYPPTATLTQKPKVSEGDGDSPSTAVPSWLEPRRFRLRRHREQEHADHQRRFHRSVCLRWCHQPQQVTCTSRMAIFIHSPSTTTVWTPTATCISFRAVPP